MNKSYFLYIKILQDEIKASLPLEKIILKDKRVSNLYLCFVLNKRNKFIEKRLNHMIYLKKILKFNHL